MNILKIETRDDFTLCITAEDGTSGIFDVKPYLSLEAFEPLNDPCEFEKINNGGYFVEWNCGADLSADTIQARWTQNAISTVRATTNP
ncbi:MAG: DUF2442 domain-containing protein [Deltaproteobacteria bacterium]|nr:DUF2442 domain-containing protein [Deltaproteobacteria bacterium]